MLKRITAVACLAAALIPELASAKTPRPLANVPLHTPDLKGIDLKKYRGKAMAILIFSTACRECSVVLNLMGKIQAEYGAQGLQVIGIAGDPNAKFLLDPFIQRYRPAFPIGYMSDVEIKKLIDVGKDTAHMAVPILVFVDKWGMVREQYAGDSPIYHDAERSIKALSLAMIKVAPVGAIPAKGVPIPQPAAPKQ